MCIRWGRVNLHRSISMCCNFFKRVIICKIWVLLPKFLCKSRYQHFSVLKTVPSFKLFATIFTKLCAVDVATVFHHYNLELAVAAIPIISLYLLKGYFG